MVWYLIVLGTTSMQTYLIPAIGIAVSFGVYRATHRPGPRAAVVSVAITAITLVLSLYYVERHLVLDWFAANDDHIAIPLVPYLDWVAEVLGHTLSKGPGQPVYSLLALVAAGWFGMRGFDHHAAGRQS